MLGLRYKEMVPAKVLIVQARELPHQDLKPIHSTTPSSSGPQPCAWVAYLQSPLIVSLDCQRSSVVRVLLCNPRLIEPLGHRLALPPVLPACTTQLTLAGEGRTTWFKFMAVTLK